MRMHRAPIKTLPSVELLNSLFRYDRNNGRLTWQTFLSGRMAKYAGNEAGTTTARGYITVGIKTNGKTAYYLAHRIIWKMMTGADPIDQVDHRDGNRKNNRWSNLRSASNGANIRNSKLRCDNKSGVKGVHWDASRKKWRAVITVDQRYVKIGRFDHIEAAKAAIKAARIKLHGEYARSE